MILYPQIEEIINDVKSGKVQLDVILYELLNKINEIEDSLNFAITERDIYWEGVIDDNEDSFTELEEELEEERDKNDSLEIELSIYKNKGAKLIVVRECGMCPFVNRIKSMRVVICQFHKNKVICHNCDDEIKIPDWCRLGKE